MDDAFSQRAEDPDTQTCFAYNDYSRGSVVKHNYVLAIERNERGRKLKGPARSRRCVRVFLRGGRRLVPVRSPEPSPKDSLR